MSTEETSENYHYVEGICFNNFINDKNVKTILSYRAKSGEVTVAGYPKSGTKWMQFIIFSILNDGATPNKALDFLPNNYTSLDRRMDSYVAAPRSAASKTHMPFRQVSFCDEAKYVFVCRNPYDTCVSYYHYTVKCPMYHFENGTFDQFLDMFLNGKVDFGDYFDHLLSWYEQRHKPNVLLMTYEDLKRDPKSCVLRVAAFLGDEHSARLCENKEILDRILVAISTDSMKALIDGSNKICGYSVGTGEASRGLTSHHSSTPRTIRFIRKGIVGDWVEYFTTDNVRKMKARIALKTAGSDVMNLWKDINLP